MRFEISNGNSGLSLGVYEGETGRGAILAMFAEAGFFEGEIIAGSEDEGDACYAEVEDFCAVEVEGNEPV
jgi:hypothetical protein